jgi:hypothetical protein
MKPKKRFKRNLKILEKEKRSICLKLELSYREVSQRLENGFEVDKALAEALVLIKFKKKFKKRLAKELGVKYSEIKRRIPDDLNSTNIAYYLEPFLDDKSDVEIRAASQKLKFDFEEVYGVVI